MISLGLNDCMFLAMLSIEAKDSSQAHGLRGTNLLYRYPASAALCNDNSLTQAPQQGIDFL